MSIGLATRQAIHEAVIGDVSRVPAMDEDAHYEFTHGRASAKVKASTPVFPRRPFMPNWDTLGTPRAEQRRIEDCARREALWDKVCLIGLAVILACLALSIYHTFTKPPSPPAPVKSDDYHYRQRATHLAVGKSIYLTDPYEQCLVGLHRDALGQAFVVHHC